VIVAGTDDVTIDIDTNGGGTNVTLADVGDSVTIEYQAATDTWWPIASYGL